LFQSYKTYFIGEEKYAYFNAFFVRTYMKTMAATSYTDKDETTVH